MPDQGLIQAIIAKRERKPFPAVSEAGPSGLAPDISRPNREGEPLEMSRRFVDQRPGDTEEAPLFIRKPSLAGFLAAAGGGEQGIRTLMAAKQSYYKRKEREHQDRERIIQKRDELAEKYSDPSLAASPEVAEWIRERQRLRETAEIPEGYVRNPLEPGKLLKTPKPEKMQRPASVAPGHQLVDPETGRVIYSAPPAPEKKGTAASREANADRDRRFVEDSIKKINKLRDESSDYNAQMRSISALGPEKQAKIDPATGLSNRETYKALKLKNDAAVKEMDRLWAQVRRTEGTRTPAEDFTEDEMAGGPAAPGGEAPPADASDAEIVKWLSSQDPDLGRDLSAATPEKRAAWLARWRKANAGP
jgi:hypothetical protein